MEAVHLIPFCISRMAGIWRVNASRLDERIEGQREWAAIAGKPVISPEEKIFYPSLDSLRWMEELLVMTME